MFAPLFICPKHGETWQVERAEEIDTEHDEIYEYTVCSKCGSSCKPLMNDGHQVVHVLSDDEIFWETHSFE